MAYLKSNPVPRQRDLGSLCGNLLLAHLATALGFAALFHVHKVTAANWGFTLLVGGQICLAGLWAGLAWRNEARRALTCLAGMALGTAWFWALILIVTQTWHRERIRWLVAQLCITVMATTFVSAATMRWRWVELARRPHVSPTTAPRPFQFSLWQLMLFVCVACLILGIGRALNLFCPPTSDEHVAAVLYSTFMWLFSAAALAGVLMPKRLKMLSIGLPFIVFGVACLLNWLTHSHEFFIFPLFAGGSTLVVMVTLLVIRRAGYRLVRKEPTAILPSAHRTKIERQYVANCGAKIAEWVGAQSDAEKAPRSPV